VFATASRSRRNTLTNVVVRQSMRAWSGNCSAVNVQVFDLLSVIQESGRTTFPGPLCRVAGANRHQTFQNVCSYYDVKITVRFRW